MAGKTYIIKKNILKFMGVKSILVFFYDNLFYKRDLSNNNKLDHKMPYRIRINYYEISIITK